MIVIDTIEQMLAHGYSVRVWCPACKRNGPTLDLQRYIDRSQGHLTPKQLGLRHKRCGRPLEMTVHPPSRHAK